MTAGPAPTGRSERRSDLAIALAPDLAVIDLARINAAAEHDALVVDARLGNGCLDRRSRGHDGIETLLHPRLEFRMTQDEQIVVHHAVQHPFTRLERIHGGKTEARRTGR